MEVSYKSLRNGHILSVGEELLLHGIRYDVYKSTVSCKYYLNNKSSIGNNDAVFHLLGKAESKYDWARQFDPDVVDSGSFPEFNSLEALTRFVVAIYETPRYEVGEYVTILPREDLAGAYPFSFTGYMALKAGQTFKVLSCHPSTYIDTSLNHYNGDVFKYSLSADGGGWNWHSSMFRGATAEEIAKKVSGSSGSTEQKSKVCDELPDLESESLAVRIIKKDMSEKLRLPKKLTIPHINL